MRKDDPNWFTLLSGNEIGQFLLEEYIGAGKIGHVYKGSHKDLPETKVAIKLAFGEPKEGWDNELKKVSKLGLIHGIAHYHAHGTGLVKYASVTRLCMYTVWDYVPPGENLASYLKREKEVDTGFLLAVVERILHVLNDCHKHGVVRHGDLHAGNILVGATELESFDDSLQPRRPIFVSDFGYGISGHGKPPKDDYHGLADIINLMIERIDYAKATATHKQILISIKPLFNKFLSEASGAELRKPFDILQQIKSIKLKAQTGQPSISSAETTLVGRATFDASAAEGPGVGQFQVSEMIGDRWDWWRKLFVPTVPARSKILSLDIPTVVTGPRGCGKTMLFRRLSERLIVECGPVDDLPNPPEFVAFYVNANDFADAFSHYPGDPTSAQAGRLICYANLCILSDLLAIQSALSPKSNAGDDTALLEFVKNLLVSDADSSLLEGEDRLERYRTILEQVKWKFPASNDTSLFPGYEEMSQHRWLPYFARQARNRCKWIAKRAILLFVDDYSTPRVTESMQRVLNRLFLQRSPEFLAKVSTEAWTTFIPQDSSNKNLQDGDDYQMVDMGEESLFLPDRERLSFLNEVFSRRLSIDPRVPKGTQSLEHLLGRMGLSKTEFARRLRLSTSEQSAEELPAVGTSQRRGRSRARVNYFGDDVFSNLWSGDTRTMIQLVSDLVDQASESDGKTPILTVPLGDALQDRVFRNRGGEWLNSHMRNEPTNPARYSVALAEMQATNPDYKITGHYGDHLKAVVEAFVAAASALLNGPMYAIKEGKNIRHVPRMAFRLEIVDEFRISGLAEEIYRDLIRYGLFMRDNRGKSVRGSFVPRLYLRRLLIPYCTLALSKRDSVPLSCELFSKLLLEPDLFRQSIPGVDRRKRSAPEQINLFENAQGMSDPTYNDLDDEAGDSF